MTKRDAFLQTVSLLLLRRLSTAEEIVEVASAAWRFPADSIPDDPALAAGEFVRWMFNSGAPCPAWVAEGDELRRLIVASAERDARR